MTFLKLQNQLKQTKKARSGVKNRTDYYVDDWQTEEFDVAVYAAALKAATAIVKHYYEVGEIDPKEKIKIIYGNER